MLFPLNREEKRGQVEHMRKILESRAEIVFAYLFGSFSDDLPFHDLDVGVYTEGIRESEVTFYAFRLAEKLSVELRLPVDVRVLNFAPVTFLYHVFRGELIHEKNELVRSQVMERTVQRYLDLKPILHRGMKEAFAA
jgi:predicted nucleotidyltransferase